MDELINNNKTEPDFEKQELIPAIIQDYKTKEVLMLAYVNRESYKYMIENGETCFFSRSRKALWHKGETSGNFQKIKEMYLDCDKDTLLILVEQIGVACHTGSYSCFYNEVIGNNFRNERKKIDNCIENNMKYNIKDIIKKDLYNNMENNLERNIENKLNIKEEKSTNEKNVDIFKEIYNMIDDRKNNPKENSYTNYLLEQGIDKICKKVGEESSETIIACKNNDKDEIISEISDLVYHTLVLMYDRKISVEDIEFKLQQRHNIQGNKKIQNKRGEY